MSKCVCWLKSKHEHPTEAEPLLVASGVILFGVVHLLFFSLENQASK